MRLLSAFKYAFSGIKEAFKEEPNFKIHTFISFVAVTLAMLLNFSFLEWCVLLLTISFVLVIELINTVLENIVDIVSPEIQEKARIAKDVSAAAVLTSALGALLIGLVLFLPKLLALINL